MRAETLLSYVRSQPFQAFEIIMNSGRVFPVRHPDFIRVGRDHFVYFHTDSVDTPHDRFDTLSLMLVEDIRHIDQTVETNSSGN